MLKLTQLQSSVRAALRGISLVYCEEQNFRIHSICALCVIVLGGILSIPLAQMLILILTIALVLVAEIINSALERFLDVIKPRMSPYVGQIKDIMAGLVLLSACVAAFIGAIIFIPPLWALFRQAVMR